MKYNFNFEKRSNKYLWIVINEKEEFVFIKRTERDAKNAINKSTVKNLSICHYGLELLSKKQF